ncbi:hypothetical protein PISMIDRAFT_10791 [Pisolithus microcarpus 441]|uniref:Uncharacterized protein n=1 Tax=Pisolithus microcarpus 441 TaxID=765257 RepID=A0A0C9ZMP7_9AGAM|nr:hypothetical protein PISMIDRAFT_10791 [Pisolithus microcarpus 441]
MSLRERFDSNLRGTICRIDKSPLVSTIALTTTETAFTETAHDAQVTKNIEKQSVGPPREVTTMKTRATPRIVTIG